MSNQRAAILATALAAIALTAAIILPVSGIAPLGDAAFRSRIAQEDGVLCARFGFGQERDLRSAECQSALTHLRQEHERLVLAYARF